MEKYFNTAVIEMLISARRSCFSAACRPLAPLAPSTKRTQRGVGLQMGHFYFFLVQHHNKQFSHEVFKGIFFSC